MILYFLKSILCLGLLLLVYHLFLEKEKMHRFNRWYLLGSIVFAFIIPLVSFTVSSESPILLQDNFLDFTQTVLATQATNDIQPQTAITVNKATGNYTALLLYGFYCLVTILMLSRFGKNIYRLLSAASENNILRYRGAKIVLVKEKIASYSFLNYIFLSEHEYYANTIEEEVITHELTHVHEKHSWDVIFIELVHAICWFNPLFIFYKKAIQLNHEYLADDAVIKTYDNVHAYQYMLLGKVSLSSNAYLTSSFNYSVTKKRLVMMTRTTNNAKAILKKIAIIPILAGALFLFSSKIVLAQEKVKKDLKNKSKSEPAEFVVVGDNMPSTKEGVSTQLMDEYNGIVKKYLYINEKGLESIKKNAITSAERERLESIYKQMNKDQQTSVKIGFMKRPAPFVKKIPTDEQFEKWKDETNYGVWIDGKKVKNEALNKYKATDFSHYFASNLSYTDKQRENIRKSLNLTVMYKVQLDLMSHAYYNDYYQKSISRPEHEMFYRVFPGNKDKEGKKRDWRTMID